MKGWLHTGDLVVGAALAIEAGGTRPRDLEEAIVGPLAKLPQADGGALSLLTLEDSDLHLRGHVD